MRAVFSEEARLRYLLQVEGALAMAHAAQKTIPKKAARQLQAVAESGKVTPQRVKEIEAEIRHDLMAVVKAMAEVADAEDPDGLPGRFVHLGATSYDTIDTANALQFRDALEVLDNGLRRLLASLLKLAKKHRHTPMLGRTHGQAAVPITFGLKMAVFAAETSRHRVRLNECRPRVLVGKMSGATGSMAAFRGLGPAIQADVCQRLGIGEATATTQIVQRDGYIELLSHLANIATSLEKFSTEVRTLQRTEIAEVAEGFDVKKQVGSSTMPHKQNPITSEQISGLSRLARSMLIPTWENAVQWNERDLANSAPERFIHPHMFLLVDHCVHQMTHVFDNLRVFPERMALNLERAQGLMMAESVMIALTEHGMGRQDAHEVVRQASMRALADGSHLREALRAEPAVLKALGEGGIDDAVDPAKYTGSVDEIIERVIIEAKRVQV
jgi:adenylosuccinate lyase